MSAFYNNAINSPNLPTKATPVGADSVIINDSASTPAGKPSQALLSSLPFAPAAGLNVVNVTTATQQLAKNTLYFVNYVGGVCTLTLPLAANSVQGDEIEIIGGESAVNGFVIAQNALQQIRSEEQLTTAGVGGTITMDDIHGSVLLKCNSFTGGLVWNIVRSQGSFHGA